MIEVRKIPDEELSNCNCCGKYNQSNTDRINNNFTENGIYEYTLRISHSGIQFRLCKDCAKDLILRVYKQVDEGE